MKRSGVIAGVVLFLACAAACSLPLLIAGGAAIGVGALLTGAKWVALVVVLVTAAVGGTYWFPRRRRTTATTECGCGGSCGL